MMKKAIIAMVALGAIVGLRSVVRGMGHKMREHCERMAAQFAGRGEVVGQRRQTQPEHPISSIM